MRHVENEKKHYRKSLDKILKNYITKKEYGDFAGILKEIFQRRAYEFEFSNAHIENEIKNFIKNIKTIKFVSPQNEKVMSANADGLYSPSKKTIFINEDHYSSKFQNKSSREEVALNLYETLTHEVYHSVQPGLTYYAEDEYRGTALNEVFIETAADRTSKSRTAEDAQNYRAETSGYPSFTFSVNLLAAAVGLTEKEILREGIQNRETLAKVISSRFESSDNYSVAQRILEKFEASLDMAYNIYYAEDEDPIMQMEEGAIIELWNSSLITLYHSAFQLAQYQLEQSKEPLSEKLVAQTYYRFLKMQKIMRDSLNSFESENYSTPEMNDYILNQTLPMRNQMARTSQWARCIV